MSWGTFGSPLPLRSVAIRVVAIDGEPWFVAKDVYDVLGYSSGRQSVVNLCATGQYQTVLKSNVSVLDTSFPNRGMVCVSEGGLYSLIFGSKMAHARRSSPSSPTWSSPRSARMARTSWVR